MTSILWLCKKLILSTDVMPTHFIVPSPEGQHFLCVFCLSFYYLQHLVSLRKEFSVLVHVRFSLLGLAQNKYASPASRMAPYIISSNCT